MSDLGWIVVRNWERFQTYDTKRNAVAAPPWIKIYTRLMSDDAFLELTGDQRAILLGLWLEYASAPSRHSLDNVPTTCRLRADTRSLTRRLNLRVTSAQLKVLEQAGFIDILARNEDARGTQEERRSYAREDVEVEVEKTLSKSESVVSYDGKAPDFDPDLGDSDNMHEWDESKRESLNGDGDHFGPQPLEPYEELEAIKRRAGTA